MSSFYNADQAFQNRASVTFVDHVAVKGQKFRIVTDVDHRVHCVLRYDKNGDIDSEPCHTTTQYAYALYFARWGEKHPLEAEDIQRRTEEFVQNKGK